MLVQEKMNVNLTNSDDPTFISKKLWSYVKSPSNNHCIPEIVNYNRNFRTDPTEKAELFNEYFYDQFSDESHYSIPINFHSSDSFSIEFIHSQLVYQQL